ncbi:hypothetical protein [Streptomyces sp. NPDC058751]|uniref:hypothetical protein n=1 Tax=Streptomyces sp. NPDC058751 TaxID=3346623 RepID=UPI0036A595AD
MHNPPGTPRRLLKERRRREPPHPGLSTSRPCSRSWRRRPGKPSAYYPYELSVAPGWKVGGWSPWSFCDPKPLHCDTCNARYEPLLTIASGEGNCWSDGWTPLKDLEEPSGPTGLRTPADAPMAKIGRGYDMQIYVCPTSFGHPHLEVTQ